MVLGNSFYIDTWNGIEKLLAMRTATDPSTQEVNSVAKSSIYTVQVGLIARGRGIASFD